MGGGVYNIEFFVEKMKKKEEVGEDEKKKEKVGEDENNEKNYFEILF